MAVFIKKNGQLVPLGSTRQVKSDKFEKLVDGTLTSFTKEDLGAITNIRPYVFFQMTNLTSIEIPDTVLTIGNYAFNDCVYVSSVYLPKSLTSIGTRAFQYFGTSQLNTFEYENTVGCNLGDYAFSSSKISKLKGTFGSVNQYALSGCSSLTEINIECENIGNYAFQNETNLITISLSGSGYFGSYAFYNCTKVSSADFSNYNIKGLYSYAFSQFGGARTSPSTNRLTLDLSNSTFKDIGQYSFGSSSSSSTNKNTYTDIYLPKSVNNIQAYAFRYNDNCNYFFNSTTPPTLSVTTAWSNATNYKIFVPFASINAYKTSTNWSAQSNYMYGYSAKNTFAVGQTLPELNAEGYQLTWYSDKALTQQVTTVTDANSEYYCTAGATKLGYGIKTVNAIDCVVDIVDTNNKHYVVGEGVYENTVLTITATPTISGYIPYVFTVNGTAWTIGNTLTVTEDINITALYWNGQDYPFFSTFSDNSWQQIFLAGKIGAVPSTWALGDEKTITTKSGYTFTLKIVDTKQGRYNYTSGGTTSRVIEFNYLFKLGNTQTWQMNTSNTNAGGWANSVMKNTHMATILADLDDDFIANINEVDILSGTGGSSSSGTSSSSNKLFLACEEEIFGTRTYAVDGETNGYGQFEWYVGKSANDRRKANYGTTSYAVYWLRSPRSGGSSNFVYVDNYGSVDYDGAYISYGVSLCFAI